MTTCKSPLIHLHAPCQRVQKSLPISVEQFIRARTRVTRRLASDSSITRCRRKADIRPSVHLLNPLTSPGRRFEWTRKVLGFVNHLAVAEFHDADRKGRLCLIRDHVFGDPEIAFSLNPFDIETGWLVRMMSPQCLQVRPSAYAF